VKPLALINDRVFSQGEQAELTIGSRRVRLTCIQIRHDSVTVLVDRERMDLVLARDQP